MAASSLGSTIVKIGTRFHWATVVGVPFGMAGSGRIYREPHVVCRCKCGKHFLTSVEKLRKRLIKSCGCYCRICVAVGPSEYGELCELKKFVGLE